MKMDPQLGYTAYIVFLLVIGAGIFLGWMKVREEVKNERAEGKKTSAYWGHKWQRNFLDDIIDPKG